MRSWAFTVLSRPLHCDLQERHYGPQAGDKAEAWTELSHTMVIDVYL
jgi:hypothetical protein